MQDLSPMPSIAVAIGGQLRIYHAAITTATPDLDSPSTLTLHTSTFADMVGLAATPIVLDTTRGHIPARLVLIEVRELAWHKARYRAERRIFTPVDPVLVSLRTLQHWLWSRLYTPTAHEAHA
jgi:hypothetical protein